MLLLFFSFGMGRDAICPVALNDGWKTSPLLERAMEQSREYGILDYPLRQDDRKFDGMFQSYLVD